MENVKPIPNPYYNNVRKVFRFATRTVTYSTPRHVLTHGRNPPTDKDDFVLVGMIPDDEIKTEQITFQDILEGHDLLPSPVDSDKCSRSDSVKRAKDRFLDICYNNRFELFCTFTFDDNIVDACDSKAVSSAIQRWCKNNVKSHGLSYILCPEYHPTSEKHRIHFHGLLKSERPFELVEARSPKTGRILRTKSGMIKYNLPSWDYGFTSCVVINDNYEACINYVSKYISKDCKKILGRFYYSGGSLLREPLETAYEIVDYDKVEAIEYVIPHTSQKIKYKTHYIETSLSDYVCFVSPSL